MKNWTPDAARHLEIWLGRVKRSVAGDPTVNPDDVAQDLRAHVYAELESQPEPVTIGELDRVLAGLGNPAQWTDAPAGPAGVRARLNVNVGEAITGWQKALAGEWGLPVLLAGLTLFAIPSFDDGGAFVIAIAYAIARAQVVHAPHRLAGRQKWLVYFPLAIGAGLLAGIVLAFPLLLSGGLFFGGPRGIALWHVQYQVLWMLGAWWTILGYVAAREPKRVQAALRPFADGFEPAHAKFLSALGVSFLIVATVMLMS